MLRSSQVVVFCVSVLVCVNVAGSSHPDNQENPGVFLSGIVEQVEQAACPILVRGVPRNPIMNRMSAIAKE